MSNMETVARDDFFESLLGDFLDESGQLLDRLNENLLQLDEWVRSWGAENHYRCNDELMNEMFRSAHSLKGLSAMLGLKEINNLTHKVENVFDAARKNELAVTGDVVELMFQAVDRLGSLVEALKEPEAESVDCESVLAGIARVLESAGVARGPSNQADAERALAAAEAELAKLAASEMAVETPSEAPVSKAVPVSETPAASAPETPVAEAPVASAPETSVADTPVARVPETPIPETPSVPASQRLVLLEEPAVEPDQFAGLTDEAEISDKYLAIFIDEAEISLDELTETLLAMEGASQSEAIKRLLITSHRIKGSAASVGLNRAAKLAHLMEDLLQNLVENGSMLSPEVTDAMLKCTDGLRQYVAGLRAGGQRSDSFEQLAHELLAARGRQAAAEQPTPAAEAPAETAAPAPTPTDQPIGVSSEFLAEVAKVAAEGAATYVGEVIFRPALALVGLKAQLIYEKLTNMGDVCRFEPPADRLDELDELEHVCFAVSTERPLEWVARQLRIGGVQRVVVEPFQMETPKPAAPANASAEPVKASSLPAAAPAVRPVAAPVEPRRPAAPVREKTDGPAEASEAQGPRRPSAAPAAETASRPTETLRVDIERLDQLMNLAGQLVINKARFAQICDSLKTILSHKHSTHLLVNAQDVLEKIGSVGEGRDAARAHEELEAVRVMARRTQGDLEAVRRDLDLLAQIRGTINDLGEAIHQLDRVTDGIQRSVMDTRMVQIGPLFTRFKRVVRDITRSNGKSIRLVIKGEKTELDKRMIDELSDPLIHMVRNSADHGIESPEVRESLGKPREGTITLDAFHRGNSIVIQVSDDGKGLDADRILQKAIDKKLVTPADAEKMTRQQIYQLIWEPGLSTAEKITEVSGRGMGMDIVKSKIEDLSGTIELDSTMGQGTTITIKLPLTLAILPSLMVDIDGDVFAMPIEAVVEIVSVRGKDVTTIHGQWTARVRGRVISMVQLGELFQWRGGKVSEAISEREETTLVIVGDSGHEIGLAVDRVLGEEDVVIKSMAENYRNVAGIAGASILGDGRVSLILDPNAVIEMASNQTTATAT